MTKNLQISMRTRPTEQQQKDMRDNVVPLLDITTSRSKWQLRQDREVAEELNNLELRSRIVAMRTRDGFPPEVIAEKLNLPLKLINQYIDWALERFNFMRDIPLSSVAIKRTKQTAAQKRKKIRSTSPVYVLPARYEDRKFQLEAFRLRRAAVPIPEIADLLKCTEQEAEKAIRIYVDRINTSEINDIEIARRLQVEQIDAAIRAVMPYSTGVDEHNAPHKLDFNAVDRFIRLLEARAKLLGLNTPQQIDIKARLEVIARDGTYELEELLAIYQEVMQELGPKALSGPL